MDFCIRAALAGFPLEFVPEAVMHVRFRDTLPGLARQNYDYSKGMVASAKRYAAHQPKGWLRGRIRRNLAASGAALAAGILRGELRQGPGRSAWRRRRSAGSGPAPPARSPACCATAACRPEARGMYQTDCVVVGAGVVGLAVARALALAGREVVVLEREGLIGSHTSSRNSEVIHAGIYYPRGSAKARLCVAGRDRLYAYCESRGVPHRRLGQDHRGDRAGAGGGARGDRRGGGGERGRGARAARRRPISRGWSRRSAARPGSSRR